MVRTSLALAALAALVSAQDSNTLAGPPMGVYKTAAQVQAVTATTVSGGSAPSGTVQKRAAQPDSDGALTPSGPPMGVYKTATQVQALTATTLTDLPTSAAGLNKRDQVLCLPQPTGIGYTTSPDTSAAFLSDSYYSNASTQAAIPSDYSIVFSNLQAANSADNYQGFTLLDSYDVQSCADQCTSISGCTSFNIYFERDPSVDPDDVSCSNPPSVTSVKCVWWGGMVSTDNAGNSGQTLMSFQVVVAGSNGYINTARGMQLAAGGSATSAAAPVSTSVSTANSTYTIYFDSDSTQGSFANVQAASSYTDCMSSCDTTVSCTAFTYVGGNNGVGAGTCWLKTSFGTQTPADGGYVAGVRTASGSVSATVLSTSTSSIQYVTYSAPSTTSTSSYSKTTTTPRATTTTTTTTTPAISSSATTTPAMSSSSTTTPALTSSSTTKASTTLSSTSSSAVFSSFAAVQKLGGTSSQTSAALSSTSISTASSTVSVSSSTLSSSTVSTTQAASTKSSTTPAVSSTATTTSSSATIPSTTTITSSSATITSLAATTFATSTKAATTTSSSTTSIAASSTPFYIQAGTSNTGKNKYAMVNFLVGGRVTFTSFKFLATKFKIDSTGRLVETNPLYLLSGYGGNVARTGGSWQNFEFNDIRTGGLDFAQCSITNGYVQCNNSGGFVYAGTCNNDGYLYLGSPSQIPNQCSWVGLYPTQ